MLENEMALVKLSFRPKAPLRAVYCPCAWRPVAWPTALLAHATHAALAS